MARVNKLAITGVLFIGLALLLAHVGVVMMIQVRIAELDPGNQCLTAAIVEETEELFAEMHNNLQKLRKEPNVQAKIELMVEEFVNVQAQIELMAQQVRDDTGTAQLVPEIAAPSAGPSKGPAPDLSRVWDFNVIIDGPPIVLPTWLLVYQFGGAGLIIFGTAFLAIGIRKRNT